jgi:hypothetical protein
MQLRHAFAPSIHRCRQQRAPVVRRGTQPPPRSKAPAPAPNRCRRQLLGRTQVRASPSCRRLRAAADIELAPVQTGELVRFAPRASKPRRRSRSGSLGQGCGWHTTQSAVGSSMRSRRELTPPTHRGRQQCAPVVRRDQPPPPRSKAPTPAPAPSRCCRRLLSQNETGVCHVAVVFEQQPASKPRLYRQAGWSEVTVGSMQHRRSREARREKGTANKPPGAPAGPACGRA